jgi:hypothetical protein
MHLNNTVVVNNTVVIPGRPAASPQAEPGIHLELALQARKSTWIPGSGRKQRDRPRNGGR